MSFPVNAHREHWPIRSRQTRRWLSYRFYQETGGTIGGQALEDGLRVLEARAANEGPEFVPFRRVGEMGGKIYLDLCASDWRAVEIGADGWEVVTKPAAKLLRTPGMRPLPDPEAGCEVNEFRRFINVAGDDDFMLVIAWAVAALRPSGPYPVLAVSGEHGSSKSMCCRLVRSLIDPSVSPIRAAPREERDLVVQAHNAHVIALDNLSWIAPWLSDALCGLSTGGGLSTRMLTTDKDEMIFDAVRPVMWNGISALGDRADLMSRVVSVHLRTIPDGKHWPEDELLAEFKIVRPRILGALLDGVSCALRNLPTTRLTHAARLADFAKWIVAAAPGLGWSPDQFLQAYAGNRRDVADATFEADPVAVAIFNIIAADFPTGWTGTPTELLVLLDAHVPERLKKLPTWPSNAIALGKQMDRVAPLLRSKGLDFARGRDRIITLVPTAAAMSI
jgi:putative DNA primase/helicase